MVFSLQKIKHEYYHQVKDTETTIYVKFHWKQTI